MYQNNYLNPQSGGVNPQQLPTCVGSPFIHVDRQEEQLEQSMMDNTQLSQQNSQLIQSNQQFQYANNELITQNLGLNNTIAILQNKIACMKAERNESPRKFYTDPNSYSYSIESSGRPKPIGFCSIEENTSIISCINGKHKIYLLVKYKVGTKIYFAIISVDDFKNGKLKKHFCNARFESNCSDKIINDFLVNKILERDIENHMYIPEFQGFYIKNNNASFICDQNIKVAEKAEIVSDKILHKSFNFTSRTSTEVTTDLKAILPQNFNVLILIVFSFLGLISTVLHDIGEDIMRILAVTNVSLNKSKLVAGLLQKFNRPEITTIPLDSNISSVQKMLDLSKDEVVCFSDVSLIDSEKKRIDTIDSLVKDISHTSTSGFFQPHALAVISNSAPYIIPNDKLFCLQLDEDFPTLDNDSIFKLSTILEELDSILINPLCKNYKQTSEWIKSTIVSYREEANKELCESGKSIYALMMTAYEYICCFANITPDLEFEKQLIVSLKKSQLFETDNCSAIINDFSRQLSSAIIYSVVNIVELTKDMNYTRESNTIIKSEDMLLFEEDTLEIISSKMSSTQNTLHILKAFDSENFLVKKKKLRYPCTVYGEGGESIRIDFIAIKYNDILNADVLEMLENSDTISYFTSYAPTSEFLPLLHDNEGKTAGKLICYKDKANQHISVNGKSGSGKTVFLSQLLCGFMNLNHKIVVFDSSDSFTKDELYHNLSSDFVDKYVTFHSVNDDDIPVNIFNLSECKGMPDKKNLITGIISSAINNLSESQCSVLKQKISECISGDSFDICNLMDKLDCDDNTIASLRNRLFDICEQLVEYGESRITWNDFISDSKPIIVISIDDGCLPTSHQLIDMMLASLYGYQIKNDDRQLDIFIDEIQDQNLNPQAPVARILKQGRKYHTSLVFATQISSSNSSDSAKIMKQAGTSVFFQPDSSSKKAVAAMLELKKGDTYKLDSLKVGECFIKSDIYNYSSNRNEPTVIKGNTFMHFNSFDNM